jgi:hypothetical protein
MVPLLIKFGISVLRFELSPLISEKALKNHILQLASGPRNKRKASTMRHKNKKRLCKACGSQQAA